MKKKERPFCRCYGLIMRSPVLIRLTLLLTTGKCTKYCGPCLLNPSRATQLGFRTGSDQA